MSWEAGESWEQTGRLEKAGSKQGMSWNKGNKVGGWRELGASWRELGSLSELGASLEQAGVRGASWEAGESWE